MTTDEQEKSSKTFQSYLILSIVTILYASAGEFEAKAMTFYLYGTFNDDTSNGTENQMASYNKSLDKCSQNSTKNEDILQKEISKWFWYYSLLADSLVLILILIMGICMDHYGRRPFILLPLFGSVIQYGLETFIIFMNYRAPYFLIPFTVSGLTGGSRLYQIVCQTMIADLTLRNKTRSVGLVFFESLLGFGYAVSQVIVGYFIKYMGYVIPTGVAAGMCLFCFFFLYAFVPESMEQDMTKQFSIRKSLSTFTGFYRTKNLIERGSLWTFNIAIVALVICYFPHGGFNMLTTIYTMGSPFCWKTVELGWYGFATSMSQLIIGVPLLKLLHVCLSDEAVGIIGCISGIAKSLLYAMAMSSWMLFSGAAGGVVVFTTLPILRAIVSRMIHKDNQGALFSNFCMIELICKLLSTTLFNNVYSATQDIMRGLTFFILAGLYFIVGLLFIPLLFRADKGTATKVINTDG